MTDRAAQTADDFIRGYRSEETDHLRVGQSAYNLLALRRPRLSNVVAAMPDVDPFYCDENLPAFEAWLRENWEAQ